jgi:phage gp16-like protein
VKQQRKTKSARSMELAKIHIAAEQLGLRRPGDDSTYRDMLWSIGRVRSAKDLDAPGREAVLRHLRHCGFVDRPAKGSGGERYEKGTKPALIRFLWTELANAGKVRDRSDRALRRYIGQHAGLDVIADERAPQHLDRREVDKVIEQLKRWLDRKEPTA